MRFNESLFDDLLFDKTSIAYENSLDIKANFFFGLNLSNILPTPGNSFLIFSSNLIVSRK